MPVPDDLYPILWEHATKASSNHISNGAVLFTFLDSKTGITTRGTGDRKTAVETIVCKIGRVVTKKEQEKISSKVQTVDRKFQVLKKRRFNPKKYPDGMPDLLAFFDETFYEVEASDPLENASSLVTQATASHQPVLPDSNGATPENSASLPLDDASMGSEVEGKSAASSTQQMSMSSLQCEIPAYSVPLVVQADSMSSLQCEVPECSVPLGVQADSMSSLQCGVPECSVPQGVQADSMSSLQCEVPACSVPQGVQADSMSSLQCEVPACSVPQGVQADSIQPAPLPAFEGMRLRNDCPNCLRLRKDLISSNARLSEKKSLAWLRMREAAKIKEKYKVKIVNQRDRRHRDKIDSLKDNKKVLVKNNSRVQSSVNAMASSKKSLKTSRDELTKALNRMTKERDALLQKVIGLREEIDRLKSESYSQQVQIDKLQDNLSATNEIDTKIPTRQAKGAYIPAIRECIYFMLCSQVPVNACGPVMDKVVTILTGRSLESVPGSSTAAQMAVEMTVISSLQTAQALLNSQNVCLSFDATSADGNHINEIHVTTATEQLVLDVRRVVGGRAIDYKSHILQTFSSIAAIHGSFYAEAVEDVVLDKIRKSITCTLADRVITNQAVVRLLSEELDQEIIELHCNVHPLSTFESVCRQAFKDMNPNIGKCLGSNGSASANLIQKISVVRYKGNGDPAGMKELFEKLELPMGFFPRYVGSRFHVLMHFSGKILLIRDELKVFADGCTNASRATCEAIAADLKNDIIIDELWANTIFGKYVSGPWMTKFYQNDDAHFSMESVIVFSKGQLEKWAEEPHTVIEGGVNVFGGDVIDPEVKDVVLEKALSMGISRRRLDLLKAMFVAVLGVYENQLSEYTKKDGRLASLSASQKEKCKNARTHNMKSEQVLALWDGIWRRTPNATPTFISGKVQCRLNKTLDWLNAQVNKDDILQFAITEGYKVKAAADKENKFIKDAIAKRSVEKAEKKDKKVKKAKENEINDYFRGKLEEVECSGEAQQLLQTIKSNPSILNGHRILHTWNMEDVDCSYLQSWFGRVKDVKTDTKSGLLKLKIWYWEPQQDEKEAILYTFNAGIIFCDYIYGDLSIIS